jgi:predicted phage tail protein
MSQFTNAQQIRAAHYGGYVFEPAKALPQTGNVGIFNVVGGHIIVTSLIGTVTTVLGATATTLSVGTFPTGGANNATSLCTAGTVTSLAAGAVVALPAVVTNALIVGGASGVLVAPGVSIINGGIAVVSPGTITITTSANDTGQMSWALSYVPIDAGATVTAV